MSSRLSRAVSAPAVLASRDRGVLADARLGRSLPLAFATAAFSGAVLVFLVQPMVAKMLLPLLGGTPAVWNTCMVFYQAVLLAGYLYAHLLTRHVRPALAVLVHCAVLALPLAVLPIAVPLGSAPPATGTPVPWLLGLLAAVAGLPFFVVSTTAPLLQRWLSTTDHPSARDPYWLYAASNAGSLLALLGYPFVVEPLLGLAWQARLWTIGYVSFAIVTAACALWAVRGGREPGTAPARSRTAVPARLRGRWVFLAFVPSSLMLGVTQHLSTDVAAVPLLWVVPLAIYLVTFIFAFGSRGLLSPRLCARLFPPVAIAAALCFQTGTGRPMAVAIPVHLALLFVAGQLCHGRLGKERPAPEHLTEFYLLIAFGGVLGGVFNALVAPLVFDGVYEYPVTLVLACLALPATSAPREDGPAAERRGAFARELFPALLLIPIYFLPILVVPAGWWARIPQGLVLVPPAFAAYLFATRRLRFISSVAVLIALALFAVRWSDPPLRTERSFFGVHTVKNAAALHLLIHGNTIHGVQSLRPERRLQPLSYYIRGGPLSQVLDAFDSGGGLDHVAIVGLGTGSMAAYGRRGQEMTFFEIDPATIRIAQDPRLFSFIGQSSATTRIVAGDGRLNLARAPDGAYGLIIVDGFSSDSIPVHLLTKQAVALYFTKVRAGGLVMFHTSNRYFELAPVLAAVAADLGLTALSNDHWPDEEQRAQGGMESQWIILAANETDLGPLGRYRGWQPLRARPTDPLWTDDYSNVLAVFRWWTSVF